ncbi:J domain-containing protein [Stieleria sp. ICT_E10.1]|uniref:J domain-containing protein n=1 Tax=Stieleria sedimenti TaxID=2976331 RepID=UPI0021801C07|nr:J domain-containing protein [Stieleria sedimenti]MCS7467422.1 J domain-containing protein [Stieleria sedimenti]
MNDSTASSVTDPFAVLGLKAGCDEAEVRARYLELVREHPPEKDAEMFGKIQAAYQAARDPLFLAKQLIWFDEQEPRPWKQILDEQAAQTPRLPTAHLLSLGNLSAKAKEDQDG